MNCNWIEDGLIGRRVFVALVFMGMFTVFSVAAMAFGMVEPTVISNGFLLLAGAAVSIMIYYFGNHTDGTKDNMADVLTLLKANKDTNDNEIDVEALKNSLLYGRVAAGLLTEEELRGHGDEVNR